MAQPRGRQLKRISGEMSDRICFEIPFTADCWLTSWGVQHFALQRREIFLFALNLNSKFTLKRETSIIKYINQKTSGVCFSQPHFPHDNICIASFFLIYPRLISSLMLPSLSLSSLLFLSLPFSLP